MASDKEVKFVVTADDRASAVIGRLRGQFGGLQTAAAGLGRVFGLAGLGVAGIGAAFAAFVRRTIEGVDQLNALKAATGSSISNLSALEDAGARTGTSFETVGDALVRFNKVLNEAPPGSANANILKQLGLDAEQLKRIDPAEALRQTAAALNTFADDGTKARAVQLLFGKSTQEVARFLQDLGEKTELVGKVSDEQASGAKRFNDALSEMRKNSEDTARAFVAQLTPSIVEFIERINKARKEGTLFAEALKFLASPALFLAGGSSGLGQIDDKLGELESKADRIRQAIRINPSLADDARIKANLSLLDQQIVQTKALQEGQKGAFQRAREQAAFFAANANGAAFKRQLSEPTGADKKDRVEQISDEQRALASYVEQQRRELDQTNELNEEQKALNFLKTLGTTGQIPQVKELVLGLATQNDALREQAEWRKLNNALANEAFKKQEELDQAIDTFAGRVEIARKQALTAKLESRLAAGEAFSPEELDKAVKGIGGISDQTKLLRTDAEEIGDAFKGSFDQASLSGTSFLKTFEAQLRSIIIRRAFSDPVGNFLSGAITGALSGFNLPFFADGGFLGAGKIGIAGESGPELILGPAQVVPSGKIGGAAIDNRIGTINVGNGLSRGEAMAMIRQALAEQNRRLGRLQQQGVLA